MKAKMITSSFLFFSKLGLTAILMVSIFLLSVKLIIPEMLESLFANNSQEVAGAILFALVLFGFFNALLLCTVIKYSRWSGALLILGLLLTVYGIQTFIGMIDALAYLTPLGKYLGSGSTPSLDVPENIIVASFIVGLPVVLIVIPVTALLFGKAKKGKNDIPGILVSMDKQNWIFKISAAIVIYELLYYGFGYFVAWQHESVRAYYQGIDHGSFFAQMKYILGTTPFTIPFQAFRAILWVVFVYPIISMFRDKPLPGALLTAFYLSVPWINLFLMLPNLVPMEVGQIHFIEVFSSNFIFGLLLFWLFHKEHSSILHFFSLKAAKARPARSES